MKLASRRVYAIIAASALALCLFAACSNQNAADTSTGDSASRSATSAATVGASTSGSAASAASGATTASGSSANSASTTSGASGADGAGASSSTGASTASPAAPSLSQIETTSILHFQNDEGGAKLAADMEAGNIPTECNVLYDRMGALPDVTVTDPETITELYDLLSVVHVVGESNMSITDSYHHISFTLQDGTRVSYGFEGEGNLVLGKTAYFVAGDGPLWSFVRQLQKVDSPSEPRYNISAPNSDLISKLPKHAAARDTVSFVATNLDDAYVEVYLDGKRLEPDPSASYLYSFKMPYHDVTIEAREVSDGAGS